jgi:hypothetical protein
MKVILTVPTSNQNTLPYFGNLFLAWMRHNNIHIGHANLDFRITFNNFYKCYDIHLFALAGNVGNPEAHWDKVYKLLESEGYDIERTYDTWRSAYPGTQVRGVRLWVKAKDAPKEEFVNNKVTTEKIMLIMPVERYMLRRVSTLTAGIFNSDGGRNQPLFTGSYEDAEPIQKLLNGSHRLGMLDAAGQLGCDIKKEE